MINNEIIIKKTALNTAILALKRLRTGTIYRNMDADIVLMNTSISESSDAVTDMFHTLQQSEDAFLELVEKTIAAMEAAGVSFEQADITAGQEYSDLPYAVIL